MKYSLIRSGITTYKFLIDDHFFDWISAGSQKEAIRQFTLIADTNPDPNKILSEVITEDKK